MNSRILFVSERREDAFQLARMLEPVSMVLDYAVSLKQARIRIRKQEYHILLTEAALPDGNWLDALDLARKWGENLEVIVTDPQADARLWSEILNLGAYDLIAQPFYAPEVQRILHNACSRSSLERAPATAVF
jgi:DNA-binding NtrC family response regulator